MTDTNITAENRKSDKRRAKMLTVRLHAAELRALHRAAESRGLTTGEWARAALLRLAAGGGVR